MKRIYIYGVITIILLYTIGWFFIANKIEKEIYSSFDKLKADKKIKKYSGSVSVSGYPFSFNIVLASPSVSVSSQEESYDINMLFDGSIKVSAGLFSRYITVTTLGNMNFKGNIGSYNFDIVSEGDRQSTYKVKLSGIPISPVFLNKVSNIVESEKPNYINLIEGVSLDIRAFTTRDKINNRPLIDVTKINLNFDFDLSGDQMRINGSELIDRVKFFRDSVIVWNNLQKLSFVQDIIKSLNDDVYYYFSVFTLPELGMMNYDINFNYVGNKSSHKIDFKKLYIRDNLYVIDGKGVVKLNQNNIDADFKSTILCSDHWYVLMKRYVDGLRHQGNINIIDFGDQSILGLVLSPITNFLNSVLQSEGYGKYVPQLHLVGPIKTEANFSYKSLKDDVFDLKIKDLHINTRTYFLDLDGNFSHAYNKDVYNINASIGNYGTVVDQIVDYINRVSSSGGIHLKIFGGSKIISGKLSERIKGFIRSVSDKPDSHSGDIHLTIINKGNSVYPAVGHYSSEEFRQAWNGFIASVIISKAADKIDKLLKKGVGDTLKDTLKGDVAGGVKNLVEGVFGLIN